MTTEMTDEELRLAIAKAKGWIESTENGARWINPRGGAIFTIPNWPKHIHTAWELVEEMKVGGYYVRVDTPFTADSPYQVKVDEMGWADHNPPPPGGWYSADTAPRAICLAWLAWKEKNNGV